MQPYLFPYVGYFQLVQAVDHFVFYDDVHFIKGGWINRNTVLANGQKLNFVIPCMGISSSKLINEIHVASHDSKFRKTIKSLAQAYSPSAHFESGFQIINDTLLSSDKRISHIAGESVMKVAEYLDLTCSYSYSSEIFAHTRSLGREERIIEICKELGATHYVNPEGGKFLYNPTSFKRENIQFSTITPELMPYRQSASEFVPALSIIDLFMNEGKKNCVQHVQHGIVK